MLEFTLRIDTLGIGLNSQETKLVMDNILEALHQYVDHTGIMPEDSEALTNGIEITDGVNTLKRIIIHRP